MRIFWLGMHKVLTQTELPRLRALGFEVFNPPYRSSVRDQSANLDWDCAQPTTLPREVFAKLSQTNFFYEPISDEIGELLNQYFDAAIVTINSTWLVNFLKVYQGKVIYRTYGERFLVSNELWANGGANLISNRDNFWYLPHSELIAENEHAWLRERIEVVPYQITEDAVSKEDTWSSTRLRSPEMMLSCPNIDDGFYRHHFMFLKRNFLDYRYRFYGVQLRNNIEDPQIVGTLSREAQLAAMQKASGYLYTYSDPNVCYLPPIEMMTIGGPVVYLPGSLLARYFNGKSPGLANDPDEARKKGGLLLKGDKVFAEEIISSQKEVRRLYHPDYVLPIFDQTFAKILKERQNKSAPLEVRQAPTSRRRLYILFHREFDRATNFVGGQAFNVEGIGRVMRLVCQAVLERTNYDVVITARSDFAEAPLSFFRETKFRERVRLLLVDRDAIGRSSGSRLVKAMKSTLKILQDIPKGSPLRTARAFGIISNENDCYKILGLNEARAADLLASSKLIRVFIIGGAGLIAIILAPLYLLAMFVGIILRLRSRVAIRIRWFKQLIGRFGFSKVIDFINSDDLAVGAIVPHYFLFEEALFIRKPLLMYIPDHIPHFYQETGDFPGEERFAATGRILARRAKVVMTNSEYSKEYLPRSLLKVALDKIVTFPLPYLNKSATAATTVESVFIDIFKRRLDGRKYIFYPTQNRPNKNLAMLFQVFAELVKEHGDFALVITGAVEHYGPAHETWLQLKLAEHTIVASGASDLDLKWLYQNCACVCITSNIEGNFPPQIYEGIEYGAPIVSSRLPMIIEMLGDDADLLLLASMNDLDDFVSKIDIALKHRSNVLLKQKKALAVLNERASYDKFASGVVGMIEKLDNA